MTLSNPSSPAPSGLVARAKAILVSPASAWDRIDAEPATIGGLYLGYAMPLAAIPTLADLVHGVVFGYGGFGHVLRASVPDLLAQAVLGYGLALASVYVMALVVDGLVGSFGGHGSLTQAMKVVVYASTPIWLFGLFQASPILWLVLLSVSIGLVYSGYLLFNGLPRVMKVPGEQALGYSAVIVLAIIILKAVAGLIEASMAGGGSLGFGASPFR